MPKIKPFDKYYEAYEHWFEQNRYAYESELKAVRHFIPDTGKGIEIGSGSGRFSIPLGIKEGIEPSFSMRKLAHKAGMEAIFGLAEHLPLADDSYDFAFMVTTICFVDRPRQSVNEMYRILKPGGYTVIGFVDKESPVGRIYQENKNKSKFYRDAHFFSAEEVKDLLVEAGFSNIEFVQTLFGKLDTVESVQDFKEGYGEGSFVVVKGEKRVVVSNE